MTRTCCGTDPNLLAEDRSPCACGLTFDDVERMVTYPHDMVRGGGLSIAEAVAREMGILPSVPMTEAQAADFAERFKAAMADGSARKLRILPPEPPLTKDQIRSLLRECVTVVKPGEVLVIRAPGDWTPGQLREYAEHLEYYAGEMGIRAMVVVGDGLGVAEAAS